MTDAERARALSGATQECLWVPTDIPAKEYERRAAGLPHDVFCQGGCKGAGRVFILDDRARRKCLCECHTHTSRIANIDEQPCGCGGSGWLTTLVIEEPCPGRVVTVGAPYRDAEELHDEQCCGGSDNLSRPDTDRIIAVLEAAGYGVGYGNLMGWIVNPPVGHGFRAPSLAVAACKALGVEVKG